MRISCGNLTPSLLSLTSGMATFRFKDKIVPADITLTPETNDSASYLTVYKNNDGVYSLVSTHGASKTRVMKTECTIPSCDYTISVYKGGAITAWDTWFKSPSSALSEPQLFDWRDSSVADGECRVSFIVDGVTYTGRASGSYSHITNGVSRFGIVLDECDGWEQVSIVCHGGTPKWQASDADWSLHDIEGISWGIGVMRMPKQIADWIQSADTLD